MARDAPMQDRRFPTRITLLKITHLLYGALLCTFLASSLAAAIETYKNNYMQEGLMRALLLGIVGRMVIFSGPVLCGLFVAAYLLHSRWRTRVGVLVVIGIAVAWGWSQKETIATAIADTDVPRLLLLRNLLFLKQDPMGAALLFSVGIGLALTIGGAFKTGVVFGKTGRLARIGIVLALLLLVVVLVSTSPLNSGRRNVLLIVLDTVAADHMASYGYHRVTTPELDRLAAKGVQFTRSYAVAPWTLPSHASMFTGLHPIQHGASQENLELAYGFSTAAEILRDEGYRTFAAVNNPIVGVSTKLHQGFVDFLPMWQKQVARLFERPGEHPTNSAFREFLESVDGGEFFAFLNYVEPHRPYHPPSRFSERFLPEEVREQEALEIDQSWPRYYTGHNPLSESEFEILNALYDGELASLSKTIDDLIEMLEDRGLLENTVVIITSDHGENLGDHGHLDHIFNLYDSVLRVPLIILDSNEIRGEKYAGFTSSVDIFATILGVARSSPERWHGHGRNLARERSRRREPGDHVAEYYYPMQVLSVVPPELLRSGMAELTPFLRRIRSIQTIEWKLIWGSDGKHELFDVKADPGEEMNLADREPERVRQLTSRLEGRLRELKGNHFRLSEDVFELETKTFEGLDEEAIERLRSLGYVQ